MANPTHVETVRQDVFAEPLGGPIHPDNVLDSFPDELYDKSPNSRLYKFIYAILGPSGIGSLVKNYFEVRLKFLENNIELFDIEKFYGDPFSFGRLLDEQIVVDVEGLLPEETWQKIKLQDELYRSRALDFLDAARLGTSPEGMRLAAKSGYGHDVEIVERYKWLFDNVSDQPLGYKSWGHTLSLNEFTIVPRKEIGNSEVQRIKFESSTVSGNFVLTFRGFTTRTIDWDATSDEVEQALRSLPVIGSNGVRVTGGPGPLYFDVEFVGPLANEDVTELKATSGLQDSNGRSTRIEIETLIAGTQPIDEMSKIPDRLAHNMQDAVDRLRPVNSLPTINQATGRITIKNWTTMESSSEYSEVVRFVTGRPDVNWPGFNLDTNKFWIRSGIEKESPRKFGTTKSHYLNFHRIQSVYGFRGEALEDPNYDQALPDDSYLSYLVENRNGTTIAWKASHMVDSNTDSRAFDNGLIQGIYPIEYASLPNVNRPVSQILHWRSLDRGPGQSEVVEIDLGEPQVVNFVTFDVASAPINVSIDFDTEDCFPKRNYVPVVPTDQNFSGYINMNDTPYAQQWQRMDCQFTDRNGQIPITRFIRLRFERRDDLALNLSLTEVDPFPVCVRGVKVGRNIT